jgi:hypothetical protein
MSSEKVGFLLDPVDGWPPHDVEHIWLERNNGQYTVKNFPFYVKGIAYEDIITITLNENGYAQSWEVITPSGNSLIWIFERESTTILERLKKIGCGYETQKSIKLHAVNVPSNTDIKSLDNILDSEVDQQKVSLAFPVFRLEDE